jgi:DNA invertase Pin-like site-specific DNA recombinase
MVSNESKLMSEISENGGREMKRAVGYVRVSTEEQSRKVSPEMQAAKIRTYAELNDLELVDIIEDAGISGKSIKARPGIQEVLNMVKARKVDAVIVYKLDRLARNTIECLNMAEGMDKAGCALHSISEKLDTQSALGRFFFTLTASLAEMERTLSVNGPPRRLHRNERTARRPGGIVPTATEWRRAAWFLIPKSNVRSGAFMSLGTWAIHISVLPTPWSKKGFSLARARLFVKHKSSG